jgi:D-alanyl-D-alanine carboxypeptidase
VANHARAARRPALLQRAAAPCRQRLALIVAFQVAPTLGGATGKGRAKTGTCAAGTAEPCLWRGQAFGGYIDARSGRRLVSQRVVNAVVIEASNDVLTVLQDEGTISALLGRDF